MSDLPTPAAPIDVEVMPDQGTLEFLDYRIKEHQGDLDALIAVREEVSKLFEEHPELARLAKLLPKMAW